MSKKLYVLLSQNLLSTLRSGSGSQGSLRERFMNPVPESPVKPRRPIIACIPDPLLLFRTEIHMSLVSKPLVEGLDTDRIAQPEDEGPVLLEDGHGRNSPPQEALATPEGTHPVAPSFGLLRPGPRSRTTPQLFSLDQELDAITHISPIKTGGEDTWWHML